jgi:penicillin-binding protein-related factor A (putative recombinase)
LQESDFQTEISRSKKKYAPGFSTKLPDPSSDFSFAAKRPFDCLWIINGQTFCFELKQVKEPEAFAFSRIEEHQKWNLSIVSAQNCHAYILINYRFTSTDKIIEKYGLQKHENFVLAIDIDYFGIIEHMFETQGRRSIPFEFIVHIYKNGFIGTHVLPWITKHKMWNVSALLDNN